MKERKVVLGSDGAKKGVGTLGSKEVPWDEKNDLLLEISGSSPVIDTSNDDPTATRFSLHLSFNRILIIINK